MGMLVASVILFLTGTIKFMNLWLRLEHLDYIAGSFSDLHDITGFIIGILVMTHLIVHRKWFIAMTKNLTKGIKWKKTTLNYFVDLGMLISFLMVFITGIIKLPSILTSNEILFNNSAELLIIHDWSGLVLEFMVFSHILLHWKWIVLTTKKVIGRIKLRKFLKYFGIITLLFTLIISINQYLINKSYDGIRVERIQIAGMIGWPEYHPELISTVRPDLFKEGHFSIFDILVYLDNINKINMLYHFDESMDTYIIDSLNGEQNFWYWAYYDGGWIEDNVFRMDHYPYKPEMVIKIFRSNAKYLESIYKTFKEEVIRKSNNNGSIIIPNVIINSPTNNLNFQDVEVTPHNLRNDTLQNGVVTAIDVIMSLGDQSLLNYELNWYETIGSATIKNFYIDGINADISYSRCGFVYEVGDLDFDGFSGNHIHIPSDIRILTSPEYEEWFWICL
jgi:hypothetical protein